MKNVRRCMAVLVLCSSSAAWASGIVRVADGDCAALAAAAQSSAGQEPSLIVLARNGSYLNCGFTVTGRIEIDGAGANLVPQPLGGDDTGSKGQFTVNAGGSLTLRQLNIHDQTTATSSSNGTAKPEFLSYQNIFLNHGTLVLDSVSIYGDIFSIAFPVTLIVNQGDVTLRNVTIDIQRQPNDLELISGGTVTVTASTFANNSESVFGSGNISVGNSILAGTKPNCTAKLTSLGGNVTDDASCGLNAANDRTVADVNLLELGTHGSVVNTIALRDGSPAIGNGVASLCEATDARGYARGQSRCDSGAYEFGGGVGKLTQTGMSGVFYDPQHDGHYVSVQRLPNETALVIWNTFDENGVPAWLFGVGNISGQDIHVDQFVRNVGGKLLPGGAVVGAHPSILGSFDLALSDCRNATMSYTSTDPAFGSGSVPLVRVASIEGVDCSP